MILKSFLSSPTTKRHVEKRVLQTDPYHLFRIIRDVDRYKEFIPLCSRSEVLRRSPDGKYFDAVLTVGYPPLFSETYVSRVHADYDNLVVTAKSIKSERLDSLVSEFRLEDSSPGDGDARKEVRVDFSVELSVSDPLIAQTLDQALQQVAGKQVEAFYKRSKELPLDAYREDQDEDLPAKK